MNETIRIGARGSKLSLRQAQWVADRLKDLFPAATFEIQPVTTTGDQLASQPLPQIHTIGIFTKQLDIALLENKVDLAVHSLKDVPTQQTDGLHLAAVTEREDARDALITKEGINLRNLPQGASVATGSLRRRAQLLCYRPDLNVTGIRGNIDTRLRKLLASNKMSGIILAFAGLKRLGLHSYVTEPLDLENWLPAPGQGALALIIRAEDERMLNITRALDHFPTRTATTAERALLAGLGGGCHVPVGAYGWVKEDILLLDGFVADPEGKQMIRKKIKGTPEQAETLGTQLAERIFGDGGKQILATCNNPDKA